MASFAQKHTKITTFHLLGSDDHDLKPSLRLSSKWKKTVLIVPLIVTEFSEEQNRPVFENIVKQLRQVTYLSNIIFALDAATDDEALQLAEILKRAGIKNFVLQHNQGSGFSSLYDQLKDAGFGLDPPGKGKNMFMSFGIAQALDAQCVAVIDADIRTFNRRQLDRLLFPVMVLNYQFSKAFYARLSGSRMYGRVKRLLVDPLLIALKRKFTESKEEKVLRLVDFLLSFHYQLSGEVAFETNLLKRMHFATNWGVEIFTLIEVYRKASSIAQVEFAREPFDHKHHDVSWKDRDQGLHKMATDIITTLFSALVIEEGLEISDYFFRDLTITYLNVADDLIKKYADNSAFSALKYDRNEEEAVVRGVFKDALLFAGDLLAPPYRITDRFLRFLSKHDVFKKYLREGLEKDLFKVEGEIQDQLFETPHTVSWERILMKLPRLIPDILNVLEEEKKIYS